MAAPCKIFHKCKYPDKQVELRSPAGPRRLRDSDAHKRIAVPKALCVLWEHPRPSPKSGKTCRFDTRPVDVGERAERSESSDTPPSETPPVSACKPLCAIFLGKPSVYPLSPVKANVGHLCEKLKSRMKNGWGIKFMAAALPDFPLLLVLRVHREPGNVCI